MPRKYAFKNDPTKNKSNQFLVSLGEGVTISKLFGNDFELENFKFAAMGPDVLLSLEWVSYFLLQLWQ